MEVVDKAAAKIMTEIGYRTRMILLQCPCPRVALGL